MSDEQEIEVDNLSLLPANIFHMVPKALFDKFIDKDGNSFSLFTFLDLM